ncbi:ferrochelatase [Candidatus Paracaedibacter symbiosus]|uniref:ferrochelatase n=1 Tax=Candidatus Paracaedibacter symbiosus TaxID=244582 RepID=UPI0005093E37|nr:ferrochelatase [Candidatus Paracaedibacter symbiosus]
MKQKIAIILQNLGGPDSPEAVRPFLYNLFADPAILTYTSPFRQLLAWLISSLRYQKAKKIYEKIGGKSPLLENTNLQAQALKISLEKLLPESIVEVFLAMRYWHPFTHETVQKVKEFKPEKVVVLPLYPQFSTTTSASSLKLWQKLFKEKISQKTVCCYPVEPGFIKAYQDLIVQEIAKVPENLPLRLLFSAHGLPQKIVDQGDPYAFQVEQSVASIMGRTLSTYEHQICYQSKVGPLQWLGPSLEQSIEEAAKDKKAIIVVPVSFVSEHSETLVELDIDFKERAKSLGIPYYGRVPAVSTHPDFINGLAHLTLKYLTETVSDLKPICNGNYEKCWCR